MLHINNNKCMLLLISFCELHHASNSISQKCIGCTGNSQLVHFCHFWSMSFSPAGVQAGLFFSPMILRGILSAFWFVPCSGCSSYSQLVPFVFAICTFFSCEYRFVSHYSSRCFSSADLYWSNHQKRCHNTFHFSNQSINKIWLSLTCKLCQRKGLISTTCMMCMANK